MAEVIWSEPALSDLDANGRSEAHEETAGVTFVDWSDPEEMLGLLIEYVQDEAGLEASDRERAAFLRRLARELIGAADRVFESAEEMATVLRKIENGQPQEFAHDPVMDHVAACIDELQRIAGSSS
jgi:hypothetical protein